MLKTKKKILILAFLSVAVLGYSFLAGASGISKEKVIELVNESRKRVGLPELLESQKLDKIAKLKAQDMLENQYFAHTSPQGKTPWDWFSEERYIYKYAGENLAIDFVSAQEQHDAWMKSETHRKNILSDKFSEIGVAVVSGEINSEKNSLIVVQVFGDPVLGSGKQENGNFFSGDDKVIDWSEKKGVVLSSQEFKNIISDNFGKNSQLFGSQEIGKIFWLFVLILSFGILVINPLFWVEKGYSEIFSAFKEELAKKKLAFKKNLDKYEVLTRKIAVKSEDHEDIDKIKTIKIRA